MNGIGSTPSLAPTSTPPDSCWQKFYNALPSKERIWCVVKTVLLLLAATILFLFNPTIFLGGFVVGILFSKEVSAQIAKVARVISANLWISIPAIAVVSFLGLHASLMVTGALLALYLGTVAEQMTTTEAANSEAAPQAPLPTELPAG